MISRVIWTAASWASHAWRPWHHCPATCIRYHVHVFSSLHAAHSYESQKTHILLTDVIRTHPAPSSRVRGYGDMRVERSAAYWIRVGIYLGWHSTSAREIYLRSSFQSTKADVSMISIHYKPTFSRFNAEGSPPTHLMPGLHDWPPVADQQWPSPRFRLIPQLWDDS